MTYHIMLRRSDLLQYQDTKKEVMLDHKMALGISYLLSRLFHVGNTASLYQSKTRCHTYFMLIDMPPYVISRGLVLLSTGNRQTNGNEPRINPSINHLSSGIHRSVSQ